jgi:low affinity Fe/Cu permease
METELLVTNVLATGTAFGVLSEDMTQNVFIPSKHAINAGLRPGQKILAKIVPNVTHGEKTPWVVISIEGHEPTTGTTLRERVRQELANGPATSYELAKMLDADVRDVQDELRAMKLPHTDLYALEMFDLLQVAS